MTHSGVFLNQDSMHALTTLRTSDDVASLRQYLRMDTMDYVDIGLVKAREQALSDWPLLAECCAWYDMHR